MTGENNDQPEPIDEVDRIPATGANSRARWTLAGVLVTYFIGAALYMWLHEVHYAGSAALYIGVPAVVALGLALSPGAKTSQGMVMKGIAIALMLSVPLLGEGIICVLMISPLFFLVGFLVVGAINEIRGTGTKVVLLVPLLLMATEGVTPATSFNSSLHNSVTRTITATPEQVAYALTQPMAFDDDKLPLYLSMGFPTPLHAEGSSLEPGASRRIHFAGAAERPALEHPHHWGTGDTALEIAVTEHTGNHVVFTTVSDSTPIASWLRWQRMTVDWKAVDATHTAVTWSFDYERLLSPAWYFQPWEQYATGKAGEYLIDSLPVHANPVNATPAPEPVTHDHG